MEYNVIQSFEDKFSKELHSNGSIYVTEDRGRAEYLIEKGYLEEIETGHTAPIFTIEDVLDQTLIEIKETVTGDAFTQEDLQGFLEFEKQNKNRKGVIEYFESLLSE